MSRRVLDRLGGIDLLSPLPIDDLEHRARFAFALRPVPGLAWLAAGEEPGGPAADLGVEHEWIGLDAATVVPARVAADFERRAAVLTRVVGERLTRELPAEARRVAVWGTGPLAPVAVTALRALERHVVAVHAPGADGTQACAGVPVRPPGELDTSSDVWVVSTAAGPADVLALRQAVPSARIVHLVEPAALRPPEPPISLSPTPLALARAWRAHGQLDAAARAFRAALRDPYAGEAAPIVYELALLAQQRGEHEEAERLLRWLLRRWPEQRAILHYNLGSVRERRGRWAAARRQFERALALTPAADARRRAGCLFHLGEIAVATHAVDEARAHFVAALDAWPEHAAARARLAALEPVRSG
jgi:tetratricopeptide (TPR) repeat protein